MVNVWATFCGPCLKEMPELAELNEEYKDKGVQITGIVLDAVDADGKPSDSQLELAKEIVQKTKADYTHIIPTKDLLATALCEVSAVPTTFFVDNSGKIVGETVLGAKDSDSWKQVIDDTLKEVE